MGAKADSIMKLISLGVNTPRVRVLTNQAEVDFFCQNGMEGWEKISIRTDNKQDFETYKRWGLPFFPNRSVPEVNKILEGELHDLVKDKIDIIVAEGIDPKDTIVSGKYLRSQWENLVDYVLGSSTVRDVETTTPKTWDTNMLLSDTDIPRKAWVSMGLLPHIVKRIISRKFMVPFVAEFSVYPYPIGVKQTPLIFWEVIEEKRV